MGYRRIGDETGRDPLAIVYDQEKGLVFCTGHRVSAHGCSHIGIGEELALYGGNNRSQRRTHASSTSNLTIVILEEDKDPAARLDLDNRVNLHATHPGEVYTMGLSVMMGTGIIANAIAFAIGVARTGPAIA